MPRLILILTLCAMAALAACSRARTDQESKTPNPHTDAPGIAWFKGDMEAAFVAASKDNKPLLLYWGAIWCPPCQQLKTTVFSRPDFIEKSRLFVPVYLDGDDVNAQKWGEEFHVQGYPTLVVLNADRGELMRIAGGLDLSQYANVLDTALADLQPIDELLQLGSLEAAACRRLAFNAWTLRDLSEAEFAERGRELANAAQLCHQQPMESARLTIFAAYFQASAAAIAATAAEPNAELRASIDQVLTILQQSGQDAKFADAFQTLDANFFKAAKAAGAETCEPLRDAYIAAMDAEAKDPSLAEADQLAALRSKLVAVRETAPDNNIPEELAAAVRGRIASALARQHIPYIRSGILNSTLNVYDVLGMQREGYELIQKELPQVHSGFYFKADLAELAEDIGRNDEALQWWDQAYRESQGAATRFQWGRSYASALMRLKPRDAARIREVSERTLAELDGPDRIYRRARLDLERLDKDLRAWNTAAHGAHSGVLHALHERLQQVCVKIPKAEPARASCDRFLAKSA